MMIRIKNTTVFVCGVGQVKVTWMKLSQAQGTAKAYRLGSEVMAC